MTQRVIHWECAMSPWNKIWLVLGVLSLSIIGCDKPSPSWDGTSLREGTPQTTEFGGDFDGFLEWVSPTTGHALVYTFEKDTNQDGTVQAKLGDHGEALGDKPEAVLFDLNSRRRTPLQQALIASRDGRYYVFERDQHMWLMDGAAGQQIQLGPIAPADLPNPCLPPRQARFDLSSSLLGYFSEDGFVVRDIVKGTQRKVDATGIWRAEPTSTFEWIQRSDAVDPPRVAGSCVCRWCARFATSMGGYQFTGQAETYLQRQDGLIERATKTLPIANSWLASPSTNKLTSTTQDGAPCPVTSVFVGAKKALLRCQDGTALFDLETRTIRQLTQNVSTEAWLTVPIFLDGGWLAPVWIQNNGLRRVGGLDLATGSIIEGPAALRASRPHSSGWQTAATKDKLIFFHLATGAILERKGVVTDIAPLSYADDAGWHVVDPVTGKTILAGHNPEVIGNRGCFVEPSGKSGRMYRGPWLRVCPK